MMLSPVVIRKLVCMAIALAATVLLAACDQDHPSLSGRSLASIPNDTMALMQDKGVSSDSPVLIRTYKQEAELEIWKKRSDGQYVYLKTFPMCRWSGQLGPKMHEGDRQVPEGFYTITPGQMNPNSHYYLSFNVGYPNAYDRVHGASGGDIMVHGICSSAGCFSMTNDQISEIYALAREAFNGGQRAIQMQSFPFKMTAQNLAKHRLDPNIAFWKMLKQGADNFEVSKQEPDVGVCARHYVFNARGPSSGRLDPAGPCPTLIQDQQLQADVAAKEQSDDEKVAKLVADGVKPVKLVYADGGMNAAFYNKVADASRPEGLAQGPTEIVLDTMGRPLPAPVMTASAVSSRGEKVPSMMMASAGPTNGRTRSVPLLNRWLGLPSDEASANDVAINEPATPEPADVPLPPRRPGTPVMTARSQSTIVRDVAQRATPMPALASTEASQQTVVEKQAATAPFYERWLGMAPSSADQATNTAPATYEPPVPEPADVPLPPRHRKTPADAIQPQASLKTRNQVAAVKPVLPLGFMALAPAEQ